MSKDAALSIVGSSRRNGAREQNDFYPTPSWAVDAFFFAEPIAGSIWEPACGDGAISKVLSEYGLQVMSTDLIDRGYGETGVDFLKTERKADNIITNPPFILAQEFIEHAKKCANKKIALFLKTTFLEGSGRYPMFKDTTFPLARVYQFSRRVRLDKNGINTGCKSGMIAFAWFVWDRAHKGPATIDWIL